MVRLNAQGVSQREIAETLKVGRGTVKRLLESAPSLPTPETATRETPGAFIAIPPELLAVGVPIRTARDLLAATDAKRKMLRLAEESGQVYDRSIVVQLCSAVSEWTIDAYGPKYWRMLESQGLDYEAARQYGIEQERALTKTINAFAFRTGINLEANNA